MWHHTRLRGFSLRNWQHQPCSTAVRCFAYLERERTCTRARQHPMKAVSDVKANSLHVQDVRCATLLSELVYRAAESPDEATFRVAQAQVEEAVGAQLSQVRCHKSGGQRFLVGETDNAIYVAFQGTKSAIDWLANLSFIHGHFGWQHHSHKQRHHHHHSSSSSGSSSASASSRSSDASRTSSSTSRSSRAHIGFLKRANSAAVSISELHAAAAAAGKRLVLTGHSLGGAVAVLTTVRLLRSLTSLQVNDNHSPGREAGTAPLAHDLQEPAACSPPNIRCISFATPAMANSDLLQEVTAAGWDQFITNIVMPEDPVVPFVNLLLKAPQAPHLQRPSSRASDFFSGLDSPGDWPSSSSSSSVSVAEASELTCRVSQDSISWGSTLTFEHPEATGSLQDFPSAVEVQAAAALQAHHGAFMGWIDQTTPQSTITQEASSPKSTATSPALPTSIMVKALTEELLGGCCSTELSTWLAAARGTVAQRGDVQPSPCSLMESSASHSSSSSASLFSLQSELLVQWPASTSDEDSSSSSAIESPSAMSPFNPSETSQRLGCSFGVPIVASWALESTNTMVSSSGGASPGMAGSCEELQCHQGGVQQVRPHHQARPQMTAAASDQAAAAAAKTAADQQPSARFNLGTHVIRQLRRLQQRLGGARVGRLAWVTGALAAGARCAAALAIPAALPPGADLSLLLGVLPRALVGPAALAMLHLVGRAAYQAALPASHSLGQQWVMTEAGLEPVAKPLASYPRTGEGLGLKELGGLFPGHRMIAYRRRLAALVSQGVNGAAAAHQ